MAPPFPFRPFLAALVEETRALLLGAVGLEPERVARFVLRPHGAPPAEWLAELTIADPSGDFGLELFDVESGRQAWFRTAHFGCAYVSAAGDDPFSRPGPARFLSDFRASFSGRDTGAGASPAIRAALDALARFLPFAPLRDDLFRFALPGSGGTAVLWLGFGCNQDCAICWQGRRWPSPPLAVYEGWLDELIAAGFRSVLLSGGEPTLLPELPALVARARRGGLDVVLETNGLRLGDDGLRRALAAAALSQLSVSLHAAGGTVSDGMTRTPGSHALTLEGLRAALADGFDVGIHCVVAGANAPSLADHARFAVRELVEAFRGRPGARPLRRVSYSFPTRPFDERAVALASADDVRGPLSAAVRVLREARVAARWDGPGGFPLCAFDGLAEELASLPSAGEGPHEGFGDAAPCGGCAARPACRGVPSNYLEALGDQGLRPLRYLK